MYWNVHQSTSYFRFSLWIVLFYFLATFKCTFSYFDCSRPGLVSIIQSIEMINFFTKIRPNRTRDFINLKGVSAVRCFLGCLWTVKNFVRFSKIHWISKFSNPKRVYGHSEKLWFSGTHGLNLTQVLQVVQNGCQICQN